MTVNNYQGSIGKYVKATLAASLILAFSSNSALAMSDKGLVIVTSFPNDVTDVYKKAFEQKYPGINVEVLSKKPQRGSNIYKRHQAIISRIFSGLQHPMHLKY